MDINFCRKIDSYLGPSFCRSLLLLKTVWDYISPLSKTESPTIPKNIILIKFWGMGTILLASPSVRCIKEKYPSAQITLLTLSDNKELCSILHSFDKKIYLDLKSPMKFVFGYLQALYTIRRGHFDTVIDLEFITNFSALTTLMITIFSKTKRIIGFNSPVRWRNSVYFYNVSFDHSRHISKIFEKMFAILDLEPKTISIEKDRLELSQAADVGFLLNDPKLSNIFKPSQKMVCVNINSGAMSHLRRWSKENFSYIIKQLLKKNDVCVALIGSKGDVNYTEDFFKQLPKTNRVVNFCGKLSISQLIGLYSKSNFLITNDSGPMHIAATIGLPTMSFFGPETPYLYRPQGDQHHIFYSDIFCSPCLNIYNSKSADCNDNVCLKKISPESVLSVIEEKFLPTVREF
jgi:ADP-heptose:LPS heptosyltransferase